jgi:hypothetical protein
MYLTEGALGFQNGDITVDDRFARFGDKSFAINKINSVEVRKETKAGSRAYIFWWGIAAIALLTIILGTGAQLAFFFIVVGGVLGFVSWKKRLPIHTYFLFLVTSSAEAQAFKTHDEDEIIRLRNAVEDAMARSN